MALRANILQKRTMRGILAAVKLVVLKGLNSGREFPLYEGKNLIGRWDQDSNAFPEVDLDEEDVEAKVSRKHASLDIKDNQAILQELGSRNGTFINRGIKLEQGVEHPINPGDEIVVGKVVLKFVAD